MDSDSGSELESKLISQTTSLNDTTDSESNPDSESNSDSDSYQDPDLELVRESIITQLSSLSLVANSKDSHSDSELESKLISLISQLIYLRNAMDSGPGSDSDSDSQLVSLITQIIHLVRSMDLESQPKPESELMSLVSQTISVFNSLLDPDSDSELEQLVQFISLIIQKFSFPDSDSESEPDSELMSLIHQIFSLVFYLNSKAGKLVSLSPQVQVSLNGEKIDVIEVLRYSNDKWHCLPSNWEKFRITKGEDIIHFVCRGCKGKNHEEYNKAPVVIFKHHLHPRHSLQLVLWNYRYGTKKCYCCDEDLIGVFYSCPACDFAINIACAEKPPVLSIDHPKWHEHTLSLFPSQASLPCNLCALKHSNFPFYICPPCDFVAHQSCISLPRLIRISRHLHRISFTSSFPQGDWSCGVCRKKIDNDYGGYSCIKNGCSFAAHSICATRSNVWDGIELEGEPEEIEEDVEPFVWISDGVIQHFSHPHHHLRLDENTDREYNENRQCQACIMPIYFGNFFSCMQCDFILHEACANFPRILHHPIHPHMLRLVAYGVGGRHDCCSACPWLSTSGFFYACGKEECDFLLHVQCGTISEPLVHESHTHPLFLTSEPGERRKCCVCNELLRCRTTETFNCIECDFALCFACATLPQKVRYKHDKHMLTLSYGDQKTSTTTYWCEACEGKINLEKQFYMCDEYCCVTLHIECLIGKDFYMKAGSSWFRKNIKVDVLPNNHHMTRPTCSYCEKRCPHKIAFQWTGLILCSLYCIYRIRFE